MVSTNLIADSQRGFLPNRDCMSNLLLALKDWTQVIELGHSVDLIYTVFTKTFDSLSHKRISRYKRRSTAMDYIVLDEKET